MWLFLNTTNKFCEIERFPGISKTTGKVFCALFQISGSFQVIFSQKIWICLNYPLNAHNTKLSLSRGMGHFQFNV